MASPTLGVALYPLLHFFVVQLCAQHNSCNQFGQMNCKILKKKCVAFWGKVVHLINRMAGAVVRCEHNFCLNRGHILGMAQPKQRDRNQQSPNKKYGGALHQASGLTNPHCLLVHKTNFSHSNSELSCCGRTKATPKDPRNLTTPAVFY